MNADTRRLAGVVEALSVDELCALTGLKPAEVEVYLDDLERRGLIERRGGTVGLYWPSSLP